MPKRTINSSDQGSDGNLSDDYVETNYTRRPLESDNESLPSPKKRRNGSHLEDSEEEEEENENNELAHKLFGSDADDSQDEEVVEQAPPDDEGHGDETSVKNDTLKGSPQTIRKVRTPSPPFQEDPGNDFDVILPWDFKHVTEQIAHTHFLNLPNYAFVQDTPFDRSKFLPMTEDTKPNPDGELEIQAQLQVENTIRHRKAMGSNGELELESNARLVEWDDGSRSIVIGDKIFDLNTVRKVKGGSFVTAHHPTENYYETLGRVTQDFVFPQLKNTDELFFKMRHLEDSAMAGVSSVLDYIDPVEAKIEKDQRTKEIILELAQGGLKKLYNDNDQQSSNKNGKQKSKKARRRLDDFSDEESESDASEEIIEEPVIAVASPPPDSGDKASRVEYIINAAKNSMDNPHDYDVNEDF